jgi:hypothetical protein
MCAMDMGWVQMLLGLAICNGRGDWVGWWRWAERGHDRLWCKQGHASLKIVPGLLRTVGADGRRTCPPPHVCTPGDCEAPTGEGASRQLPVQRRHVVPFPQLRCDGGGWHRAHRTFAELVTPLTKPPSRICFSCTCAKLLRCPLAFYRRPNSDARWVREATRVLQYYLLGTAPGSQAGSLRTPAHPRAGGREWRACPSASLPWCSPALHSVQ